MDSQVSAFSVPTLLDFGHFRSIRRLGGGLSDILCDPNRKSDGTVRHSLTSNDGSIGIEWNTSDRARLTEISFRSKLTSKPCAPSKQPTQSGSHIVAVNGVTRLARLLGTLNTPRG
jgi:hypothetical protein